jgi:hypothetical protein
VTSVLPHSSVEGEGAYWRPSGRALNVQQTLPGLGPRSTSNDRF